VAAAATSPSAAAGTASTPTTAAATASTPTTAATGAATASTPTTAATTASRLKIRVADDESASHQALGIVYLGAFDERSAISIDQDADRVRIDDEVVFGGLLLHAEHVLHAPVGAGCDHHSEHAVFFSLFLQQVAKLLRGQVADLKDLGGRHLHASRNQLQFGAQLTVYLGQILAWPMRTVKEICDRLRAVVRRGQLAEFRVFGGPTREARLGVDPGR
jgi:hypothetical protein